MREQAAINTKPTKKDSQKLWTVVKTAVYYQVISRDSS